MHKCRDFLQQFHSKRTLYWLKNTCCHYKKLLIIKSYICTWFDQILFCLFFFLEKRKQVVIQTPSGGKYIGGGEQKQGSVSIRLPCLSWANLGSWTVLKTSQHKNTIFKFAFLGWSGELHLKENVLKVPGQAKGFRLILM